jgi:hypothetical protein
MMQLSPNGNVKWFRTCGGVKQDGAQAIPQTADGGFVAAGYTESFTSGDSDVLVVKLNSQGQIHPSCDLIQSADPLVTTTAVMPQEGDLTSYQFNRFYEGPYSSLPHESTGFTTILCEAPPEHKLHLSKTSGGKTIPRVGAYSYEEGTKLKLTALPKAKFRFKGWTGDVLLGREHRNPLKLTIDSIKYVKANFIRQYRLMLSSGIGGSVTPNPGTHKYDKGVEVTLAAYPDDHYIFGHWSGDATGPDNPKKIALHSNLSVKANFIRLVYAPLNLSGQKILNRSLSQVEYIDTLSWQANPNNIAIEKYRIYRVEGGSRNLLTELNAGTLEYQVRAGEGNKPSTYSICAVNEEGREGQAAQIIIQ